jgi:hypothetical protein
MSKDSNSTSIHRDERTSHREVAQQLVGAPDKIRKKWSVQILRRGSLTGPAFIEFKFPTQGGGLSELTVRTVICGTISYSTISQIICRYFQPTWVQRTPHNASSSEASSRQALVRSRYYRIQPGSLI